MPLRWLLRRLDLGPSQERVVREAVGRVREIHDVLDSEQREGLARVVERGPHRAW
jgi:hypothetical protein